MTTEPPVPERLSGMITGYWASQIIYVAAKLKLADRIVQEAGTAAEIAASTGTHGPTLYRILRALASLGIFSEDADGRFSSTPMAEGLRSDVPGSQWALAIMMGEERYRCWGDLLESARTGGSAFERLYGKPLFEYLPDHAEPARIFDEAMTGVHGRETRAMLDAYDFSGIGVLADIGGGNGSTLIEVLRHYPRMRGILFDLPNVARRGEVGVAQAGLADRCGVVGGSFFAEVPASADAYLLRHIIHDWDDDKATAILRSIHRAMSGDALLLVVEGVIPPGNGPSFVKLLDLAMLVGPGGRERTGPEYQMLFERAGFRLSRVVATAAEVCIIEGRKAASGL